MPSLLNHNRPPAFCPGCSHERVIRALDDALTNLGKTKNQTVLVSDIGCSGLFDTFFNTHALHGLHGRALTYATGIKLARPELTVIVTMGDGGLGIGGAHMLSTCRRNIDLTLLVLNNFNYGMTGGQCSATTPMEAQVASGFLNQLEQPLDICRLAGTVGAGFVARNSTYADDLVATLKAAISHEGFSVLDIWGICTGRYTRGNKITPRSIAAELEQLPSLESFMGNRSRPEYGRTYRAEAAKQIPAPTPIMIEARHTAPVTGRNELLFLGNAGQRIVTAGEILCLAGATAGLKASQKNDYPITVMRGHSISEMILSDQPIGFNGIHLPDVVVAMGQAGVDRRKAIFDQLPDSALVLVAPGVTLPPCKATIRKIDVKHLRIKSTDWALAALAWLSVHNHLISFEMLESALKLKFHSAVLEKTLETVHRVKSNYEAAT